MTRTEPVETPPIVPVAVDRDQLPFGQKLNAEAVREIRRLLADEVSQSEIARAFGISQPTVSAIKHRRRWAFLQQ